jgi:hypothetical protein
VTHRFVHFSADFFADLDRSLPVRRTDLPSRQDFLEYELGSIREHFSQHFDELPPAVPGRADYRLLIAAGSVVRSYAVIGQLDRGGGVEILSLRVEPWPSDSDEVDDD